MLVATSSRTEGISYTELLTELQISTGRLNYHLRQMDGFLEKNDNLRYTLTPLGVKTMDVLTLAKKSVNAEENLEKYYRPALNKSPLQLLVRSMACILFIGVLVPLYFIGQLTWTAIAEGAEFSYILFNLLAFLLAAAIATWILAAFKYAPGIVKRVEGKLYD